VDSLRADHLGCYGYRHPTSPNIDRVASQGVLFEHFYCSALPTQPSFTTVYTGQHPLTHGIVSHGGVAELSANTPTLPQVYLRYGYTTCALDNLMRERLWFGRGYEYYIDPSLRRVLSLGVTCEELNARAIPWIREHADEPFFFFIHYWDPHTPYTPPDKYKGMFYTGNPTDPSNRSLDNFWRHPFGELAKDTWLRTREGLVTDADYVTSLYDQEIRHVDEGIGELVQAIDDLGIGGDTVVAIIGDHGESMTEHGIFYEHHGLYEPTLHIPLVVRCPGLVPAGSRRGQMLQHQDLAPTLLQATGLPVPRTMESSGFWPVVQGSETGGGREYIISAECTLQAKWSIRTSDHKLIVAREPDFYGTAMRELYDVRSDPGEEVNIVDQQPELAASLEQTLENWIADNLRRLGRTRDPLVEQGVSLKAVIEQPA
jgi:arylsulfatase A-like enzyme